MNRSTESQLNNFLRKPAKTAEIVVSAFNIILEVLNTGFHANPGGFKKFAHEIRNLDLEE